MATLSTRMIVSFLIMGLGFAILIAYAILYRPGKSESHDNHAASIGGGKASDINCTIIR